MKKFKKGDRCVCIKKTRMKHTKEVTFKKGRIYSFFNSREVIDEQFDLHIITQPKFFKKHFVKLK